MLTRFEVSTDKNSRYQKALKIISSLLPESLTEKEIIILSTLFDIPGPREMSTRNRRTIREQLSITESDLNNYIKQLRGKRILIDNKIDQSLDIVLPETGTFDIVFSFAIPV